MDLATWPSVIDAVNPPATDPSVGPFVCAHIPVAWLPHLLGALGQWMQPGHWGAADDATLLTILDWADTLIRDTGQADTCPEVGVVSVSIAGGAATGTAAVTFPTAFTATPTVVVST